MRALCILILVAGCGGSAPRAALAPALSTGVREVHDAQSEFFHELAAADARFAARAGIQPTQTELTRAMQASLAVEEAAGLLAGAPDPFTRAPRAMALAHARARLGTLAPSAATARAELAMLHAVLREEEARFAREATLPAASVRLIHALAATPPPRSEAERAHNDAALTRRLGDLEDALDTADTLDGDAIEDALDELEPRVAQLYPEATRALTSLRLACSRDLPAASGARALPQLAMPLSADASVVWSAQRQQIRAEIQHWHSAVDSVNAADREQEATALMLGRAACSASATPLSPSPERRFGCAALARGAEQPLLLELVVHDLLTAGLWALELAAERGNYRRVLSQYAMAGRVSPDVGGRLARTLAAEPEAALRAALIAQQLAALPAAARPAWIRAYLARGAFLPAELAP